MSPGKGADYTELREKAIELLVKCRTWTPEKEMAAEAAVESVENIERKEAHMSIERAIVIAILVAVALAVIWFLFNLAGAL